MPPKTPFIDALLEAMPTPFARMACNAVLARFAGASIYIPTMSKVERRQQAAKHMLESASKSDGEIVQILRIRFNVSERTAWRDVESSRKKS